MPISLPLALNQNPDDPLGELGGMRCEYAISPTNAADGACHVDWVVVVGATPTDVGAPPVRVLFAGNLRMLPGDPWVKVLYQIRGALIQQLPLIKLSDLLPDPASAEYARILSSRLSWWGVFEIGIGLPSNSANVGL